MELSGLSPETLRALEMLGKMRHDPLCPKCGLRRVDPKAESGWCVACESARQRTLESKRRWWARNRGAEREDAET